MKQSGASPRPGGQRSSTRSPKGLGKQIGVTTAGRANPVVRRPHGPVARSAGGRGSAMTQANPSTTV